MSQKIAVALIHGAGTQSANFADAPIAELTRLIEDYLPEGNRSIADKFSFQSIYWANILARKQRILWNIVDDDDDRLDFKPIRKFMMNFGADAIAYQPSATHREVYDRIHQMIYWDDKDMMKAVARGLFEIWQATA